MTTRLPTSEYWTRIGAVRDRLSETDTDAAMWFNATSIECLTGFGHIQTERPVILALTEDRIELTAPRLERNHQFVVRRVGRTSLRGGL